MSQYYRFRCKNHLAKGCHCWVWVEDSECYTCCMGAGERGKDTEGSNSSAHALQSTEHTLPILATRSYRDWSKDITTYDIFHADNGAHDLPHLIAGLSLTPPPIEKGHSQKTTIPLKIPPRASTNHDPPSGPSDHTGGGQSSSTREEKLPVTHTTGLEISARDNPGEHAHSEDNSLNDGVKREENNQPMSPSAISLGSYDMLGFDDSDNGVKTHTPGGTQKKRKISGGSAEQSGSGSNDQSPDGDEYDSSDQHPLGGGGGGGRRKRGGAGGSGLPFVKRYACPYFKYNPDQYRRCGNWSCSLSEKHRVRSHVFRTHLKPEECLFGCGYRAGQPHQMRAHFEAGCKQDTRPVSSDMDTEQKAQRLMRGFSWQQIYACLFDCDVDRVPDPYIMTSPSSSFAVDTPQDDVPGNGMPGPINLEDFGRFAWERLAPILQKTMEQALPSILAEYQLAGRAGSISTSASASSQSLNLPGEGMAGLDLFYASPFTSEFGMDHDPQRVPQSDHLDSRDEPQPQVDGDHEPLHQTQVMPGVDDEFDFDIDEFIRNSNSDE